MKVGVNLINFGPGASPESFASWARLAERLGFHFVAISDHVALTPDVAQQYPAPFYDPFTVLSWLAGTTETLELATTVAILPYRHPLQLARVGANLDRISNGRFILGLGVGWAKREFEALGIPWAEKRFLPSALRLHWSLTAGNIVAGIVFLLVGLRSLAVEPGPLMP